MKRVYIFQKWLQQKFFCFCLLKCVISNYEDIELNTIGVNKKVSLVYCPLKKKGVNHNGYYLSNEQTVNYWILV